MSEEAPPTGPAQWLDRLVAPHRPALALALLAGLLYLPSVWLRDPWNPDEPRYAEVVRQMAARGDYLLPWLNGEVYSEKPPVFFWLGVLAGRLPGVPPESGPRLIAALAAWATLLATFSLGRRMAGARAGWLAAVVLATSALFAGHACSGVIDGLLTALVTAAVAAGLRAREAGSAVLWAGFYALCGVAVITKGPVGFLLPALTLWLLALQDGGPRGAWAAHAVWGTALAAAVAGLWVAPAIARGGPAYADVILLKQNVGRAYQSWHHRETIDYFLKVFPGSFLPWVTLLPAAVVTAWRRRRRHAGWRVGLTWFVGTFLFFSLISGKKTRYLLPLFPAAAMLVGMELDRALAGASRPRRTAVPLAIVAALLAALGLALAAAVFGPLSALVGSDESLSEDQSEALLWYSRPPGGLLLALPGAVVAALAIAALVRLARPGTSLALCLAACLLLLGWTQWVGSPALDHVRSARVLALLARAAAGRDGPVILYRESRAEAFNLHMERDRIPRMTGLDRTAAWLRERPGAVVLLARQDLGPLEARVGRLETVACRRVGSEALCAARVTAAPEAR